MIFESQVINVFVEEESPIEVNADITIVHNDADYYEGDYVVTPLPNSEVILETKDKVMSDNVTVQAGGGSEPNLQDKTVSYTPTESQQTATIMADVGYDGLDEVDITVGAISSTYVGSGITQRSSSDLTASGALVSVPSGYYEFPAAVSVVVTSMGTPTARKGAVSNHSIAITPSVTNSEGYINGGTVNGSAVYVNASELVSGTKSITANGTGIDVTNYASVDVAVPQPSGTKNITISANGTTTENVADYVSVQISANVPNSYSASDEGKVVSSGELVAQDSAEYTQNGTYDTTLKNSVTVNVSGSEDYLAKLLTNTLTSYNVTGSSVKEHTFRAATALTSITFSNTRVSIGTYAFYETRLPSVVIPSLSTLGTYAFANLNANATLKKCDFNHTDSSASMANNLFSNATGMNMLVLRRTSGVVSLGNINTFATTPFASGKSGGTLYVPNSLISSYQNASNWSTILGYTNNSIKSIESTHTDPDAPIDLTLYYADGTPLPS